MTESMDRTDCSTVAAYLDGFGRKAPPTDALDGISEHLKTCRSCFQRVADFFRLLKAPTSDYVKETIDDLALAIYNLVKSLVKSTPSDSGEESHENVRFTSEPGDASEYIRDGAEAIDDVEDFLGTADVAGENMESLRAMIEQSHRRLAMKLLQKGVDLGGPYALDCRNLQGIIYLNANSLDEAEKAFANVIAAPPTDAYVRRVQMHAMINLAYVHHCRNGFDDAVKWADRSRALAEEIGLDAFTSRFGLAFFLMERNAPRDIDRAAQEIAKLIATEVGIKEFRRYIEMPSNKIIKDLFHSRGLAEKFAATLS